MSSEERLARLENRVVELSHSLERIESRLAAIEGTGPEPAAAPEAQEVAEASAGVGGGEGVLASEPGATASVGRAVSLLGRTLVVLGGAYLLRAITDSQQVPQSLGLALGLAFALLWVVMADRVGGRGRPRSAVFHGVAAAAVAYPLVWEAARRFEVFSVEQAAAVLGAVSLLLFAVAARRRLRALAWVSSVGGVAAAWALLVLGPGAWVPVSLLLISMGLVALWLDDIFRWSGLPWMVALVTDLTVTLLLAGVVARKFQIADSTVLTVLVLLVVPTLGSILADSLWRGRMVRIFEVFQSVAVLGLGAWGVLALVSRAEPATAWWFGGACLGLACAAYAVAFQVVRGGAEAWRKGHFVYLTGVGWVLVLVGCAVLLPRPALAAVWSALAVVSAASSRRLAPSTLAWQSALYLLPAALASSLVVASAYAFVASGLEPWPPVPPFAVIVLVAAAASLGLLAGTGRAGGVARVARLIPLALLVWGLGGLVLGALAPFFAGPLGPEVDRGALATLRTGILAVAAVVLEWIGRERLRVALWLAYPVLLLGGLKLVLEDFPQGRAATLFVGLALYGCALIVVARLARRS